MQQIERWSMHKVVLPENGRCYWATAGLTERYCITG